MSDCKHELTYILVASKILPSLIPYVGNPTVDINEVKTREGNGGACARNVHE